MFDLVRRLNKFVDDEKLEEPAQRTAEKTASLRRGTATLRELAATLGLFRKPPAEKAAADDALVGDLMKLLIDLRAEARKRKDFATADRIRNGLSEIGVTLEDRAGGTEWTKKRMKGGRMKRRKELEVGISFQCSVFSAQCSAEQIATDARQLKTEHWTRLWTFSSRLQTMPSASSASTPA